MNTQLTFKRGAVVAAIVALGGLAWYQSSRASAKQEAPAPSAAAVAAEAKASAARSARPALSVQVVRPEQANWPLELSANGAIAAWQEAVVGAELSGLRLDAVLVNVGDRVRKGQVLATLAGEAVRADILNAQASLQEAQALAAEAKSNADRARNLRAADAISAQEAQRSLTSEQTALARVESAKAQLAAQELRGRQTRVVAPDDGVISARSATVGAVAQPGVELFRLIRQSRLEWRAELPSADLLRVQPGMKAVATPPGGQPVEGRVRMVAPTVDGGTRNGIVYVDLPASATQAGARAGMFAAGKVAVGQAGGLTVPQTAVLLRDGFSYVFVVEAQQSVRQVKVKVGRRQGERIEVLEGLKDGVQVVAAGVAFLADGDTVRVVGGRS
jgi:RND family efflux transporter MFP subunit